MHVILGINVVYIIQNLFKISLSTVFYNKISTYRISSYLILCVGNLLSLKSFYQGTFIKICITICMFLLLYDIDLV